MAKRAFTVLAAVTSLLWAETAGAQQRGLGDLGSGNGGPGSAGIAVDVELVLAVDVSWSMDRSEQEIQREGYAAAFRSKDVQDAILDGVHGKVAVIYVEWAGTFSQSVVVPWMLIDSKASADDFAYRLSGEVPIRARRTSISSAIDYTSRLFDANDYAGLKQVIDISGDGPNNQGRMVTDARDAALDRGVTINGLPLMTSGGYSSWGSIPDLDAYYADCVIGGPGSFVIPVNDWSQFPEAVRRKLVLELAGGWPSDSGEQELERGEAPILRTQIGAGADCLVGERQWQDRQRRWMNDDVP